MVTTDNQYSLKMRPNLIERRNKSSEHQHLQLYEIIPVNSSAFGLTNHNDIGDSLQHFIFISLSDRTTPSIAG